MTMKCSICLHPKVLEINKALVQGKGFQMIANTFGSDWQSVRRHSQSHLPKALVKAYEKRSVMDAASILDGMTEGIHELKQMLDDSKEKKTPYLSVAVIREIRGYYEALVRTAALFASNTKEEWQTEQEQQEQDAQDNFREGLKVLSFEELSVLQRIQDKITKQDRKIIIFPDKKNDNFQYHNEQQFLAIETPNEVIYPDRENSGLKRGKPPHKTIIEPIQETVSEYNARIEAEEYGQHLYRNGRIISNKGGDGLFPGECKNVITHYM